MKGKQGLLAALLLLAIGVAVWRLADFAETQQRQAARLQDDRGMKVGERAPDCTFEDAEGSEVSLTSLYESGDTFLWFYSPG